MDLFKSNTMRLADSLDWNAKCCKRARKKKDTKLIHRNARRKLCKQDQEEIRQVLAFQKKFKNFE